MTTFKDMALLPKLQFAVEQAGFTTPTPIQEKAIPLVMEGGDVLGCAQTGTGKTAAFALPILNHLLVNPARFKRDRKPRALILAPTRELAQQTQDVFTSFGKKIGLYSCVIYGGVSQMGQTRALSRGVDTIIATPGRLNDLIQQGEVNLEHIEVFVLDEADRMLDMGFMPDVTRIQEQLPKTRQTLLFSATMPPAVETLALSLLKDPKTVKVAPEVTTVKAIDQQLYYIDKENKKLLLAALVKKQGVENVLVFSRTKHGADRIVRELADAGIRSAAIHGEKTQAARQKALNDFKQGIVKVLVATDIAARGIDILALSHVVNYDLPEEAEAYVHRIGRTGRAGRSGCAISFCSMEEMSRLKAVQKFIRQNIPVVESPWPMTASEPAVKRVRGGQKAKSERFKSADAKHRGSANREKSERFKSADAKPKSNVNREKSERFKSADAKPKSNVNREKSERFKNTDAKPRTTEGKAKRSAPHAYAEKPKKTSTYERSKKYEHGTPKAGNPRTERPKKVNTRFRTNKGRA